MKLVGSLVAIVLVVFVVLVVLEVSQRGERPNLVGRTADLFTRPL